MNSNSTTNTTTNAKVTLAWAWGFEDGATGESFYHGNDLFVGKKLVEWRAGWTEAQKVKAQRVH